MIHKRKLVIFDTTLRDGEQSPGVTLNTDEKVKIAKQLSRLGVDVIEAGFPVASPGDFLAVERIAREVGPLMEDRENVGKPLTICALARAVKKDIETAYDAIKDAPSHRIHTFLATSDIHLEHKLKISREQCIERAVEAVKLAKSFCNDVEFSPEDAARSDHNFLVQILTEIVAAGATTINIPDTVGYLSPTEYGDLIKFLIENVKGSDKVIWSTHCHNDLGLATANTLAGIMNGALQTEVTINGIGERAGNTSLEEVVMNIHTHPNVYPAYHTINTKLIAPTSRIVSDLTGMIVQPNKAIVGKNAFLHESGIHQDGVLKNKETYEIIRPEDVGIYTSNLLLGKHSGRHAIKSRLEELGYLGKDMTEAQVDQIFKNFKRLADSKKTPVTDDDLHAIVSDQFARAPFSSEIANAELTEPVSTISESSENKSQNKFYELASIQVVNGTNMTATATVTLKDISTGELLVDAALASSGPVEAIFNAIKRIIDIKVILKSYSLSATSSGSDSVGKVVVRVQEDNEKSDSPILVGVGADIDVLTASALAYVAGINRILIQKYDVAGSRSSLKDRSAPV
ncbi:hypothetical protein BB560_005599 [Smittium megazygosporum]|uniref:2-isopropylmalate synthase n=1 Tax=Smittium megazygosporum TaxID=133381 RepID=A0A2T9Z2K8_9FUNG|nr:hypothetical protein BB560_005599 [Smittium megazygosporum]